MKWMLVFMIFGLAPVKTGLVFDSLDECIEAEEAARVAYADAYDNWREWAKSNPDKSGFPGTELFVQKRIGLKNEGTCIPHAETP